VQTRRDNFWKDDILMNETEDELGDMRNRLWIPEGKGWLWLLTFLEL